MRKKINSIGVYGIVALAISVTIVLPQFSVAYAQECPAGNCPK